MIPRLYLRNFIDNDQKQPASIYYLVLNNTIYRIVVLSILDLFVTHLPNFDPKNNYGPMEELK